MFSTLARGLAVAVSLALLGTAAGVASAHPGQPSGVFDPDEVSWYSHHNKSVTEFDDILRDWSDRGFMPVDFEADGFDSQLKFGGAAQRNLDGRAWLIDTVMTPAEYATKNADAIKRNMRLVDREMYYSGGKFTVGGLWVANPEGLGWVTSNWDLTLAQLNTFVAQQDHSGRLPIDFDMYKNSSGQVRYSVEFLDNPEGLDWHLRADLTYAQFLTVDSTYGGAGFRTISMDSAADVFGGIWWENANGRTWASRINSTETTYANAWGALADQGLRQIFNGRYLGGDGKVHLMQTWRQNNDRYNWQLRSAVDGFITGEMGVDSIPGVSVSVMQNGEFLYSRGFGYADIAHGVTMNSAHVLRTASVSKAIGGTLLLKVAQEPYGVTVTDAASLWADLPAAYDDVTLEMLASNRGCVRWYAAKETFTDPVVAAAQAAADAEMAANAYATSAEALPLYSNDPLVCTPGKYHYSTQAYGVLGAALETATTQTSADLVENYIAEPLGLSTLAAEDLSDATVNRAKAYSGAANTEVDLAGSQKSFAQLGGGIWSNSADLCSYGHALVTGQIIDDPEDIWTASPWTNYAYGWYLGSENGHLKITKDGKATGADSYLIAYPDDDIVISVLINREELSGTSSAQTIADFIGGLLV